MITKTKSLTTSLGIALGAIACRYIWEYIDPWIGMMCILAYGYLVALSIYKLLKQLQK